MRTENQFAWGTEIELFGDISMSHNGDSRANVRKVNRKKGKPGVRKMRD
jgi:hypothetical protein